MDIATISTYIGVVASVAGGCAGLWKIVIKPLFSGVKKIQSTFDIINEIQSQLVSNGGSSLRDAINRIEGRILLEQHARRATSMILDVGIFETDKIGGFRWVNKKYCDITGLFPKDAEGFGWVNGIHFDDRERVIDEWMEAVKQKRAFNTIVKFNPQNPFDLDEKVNITTAVIYAVPALDNNGEIIGYIGIVTPLIES